jgi:hypothetical protein
MRKNRCIAKDKGSSGVGGIREIQVFQVEKQRRTIISFSSRFLFGSTPHLGNHLPMQALLAG